MNQELRKGIAQDLRKDWGWWKRFPSKLVTDYKSMRLNVGEIRETVRVLFFLVVQIAIVGAMVAIAYPFVKLIEAICP